MMDQLIKSVVKPVSEDCLLIEWPDINPNPQTALYIGSLADTLLDKHKGDIINLVPSYTSLLVQFDILRSNIEQITALLNAALQVHQRQKNDQADGFEKGKDLVVKEHRIPVCYHSSLAPDLHSLGVEKGLSIEQIIAEHTGTSYCAYAVGFEPGFAYLGHVPDSIATIRHHSFKAKVAAGSVGIADRQTAIYPNESPGGWKIIGRTPQPMLMDGRSILSAGDHVRFIAISLDEFLAYGGVS